MHSIQWIFGGFESLIMGKCQNRIFAVFFYIVIDRLVSVGRKVSVLDSVRIGKWENRKFSGL